MRLEDIRKDIDNIDSELKALLVRRMALAGEVVKAKIASGDTTIYRADREADILDRICGSDGALEGIFGEIMLESRTRQYRTLMRESQGLLDEYIGSRYILASSEMSESNACVVRVLYGAMSSYDDFLRILSIARSYGMTILDIGIFDADNMIYNIDIEGGDSLDMDALCLEILREIDFANILRIE